MSRSAWTELIPPSPTQRTCSGIRLMTSPTRSRSEKVPPQVLLNSVIVGINRWVYKMELQSKWARMLFYGPLLGGCMIPMTAASVLAGAWAPSLVASAGLGVVAGLWRASARRHKAYVLNPCCPTCGRDLVDCLSEKTFRRSKCKGAIEVAADE